MRDSSKSPRLRASPGSSRTRDPQGAHSPKIPEGWLGWDEYAPFYDWENRRTFGRRDLAFWRRLAKTIRGPVLELGCGTGRLSWPLAGAGVSLVGVDRSEAMLARARRPPRRRGQPGRRRSKRPRFVRGDIRALPFRRASVGMILAPYGVLQSLVRERDLTRALAAARRVLAPGGLLGIDLVPDVPRWREYRDRVQLRGRLHGRHVTLVESVRQDRARRLTTFEQRYQERRRGGTVEQRFHLTFRTLPLRLMVARLARAGFVVEARFGDYQGGAWGAGADAWIVLARRAG